MIAKKMAQSGRYDAIICVGAVIRGATSHYDYVCNETAKGSAMTAVETGIPVLFGVLTTDTIEQAIERAGTKAGNKGYDCAMSALEMINLGKKQMCIRDSSCRRELYGVCVFGGISIIISKFTQGF